MAQLPPIWLRQISDLLQSFDEEEDAASELSTFALTALPVCDIDCTDGEMYYQVLGAWCVPWSKVPLTPFMKAWLALTVETRRSLLATRNAFAKELDVDAWETNLLINDDVAILAAMPRSVLVDIRVTKIIAHGAAKCMELWTQRHGWTDGNWHSKDLGVDPFASAAEGGHLAMLRLLCANITRPPWWDQTSTMCKAALGGHVDCIAFLHDEQGVPWNEETCASAAGGGSLNCLTYLHEHGCPWHRRTCTFAANGGFLDCVKYVHERGCIWDEDTCRYAVGHLDCIVYLHEQGCPWNENTCAYAAEGGHLDSLMYAHKQGCPWDNLYTCAYAAGGGHLDCLTYAHEHGCPWGMEVCYRAARGGHLACLAYSHEHGCPCLANQTWGTTVCYIAANGGFLDCLAYAHEHGCPWNKATCEWAAVGGSLECLTYLHKHGCPWDERTCFNAARKSHLECLKYAVENGCPFPWTVKTCKLDGAFNADDLRCFWYVHQECVRRANLPWWRRVVLWMVVNLQELGIFRATPSGG